MKTFKLPLRTKDLSILPEQYRGAYAQDGDEYVLSGDVEIEDVTGLKTALKSERDLRSAAEKRAKALPDDFDPEEYTTLRNEKTLREQQEAERKGEYQKLLQQNQAKADKIIADLRTELAAAQTETKTVVKKNFITEELSKRGLPVKVFMPHLDSATDAVKDENGNWILKVMDGKKIKIGKSGDEMTLNEFVDTMSEDPDWAGVFPKSQASGGGTRGDAVNGGGGNGGGGNGSNAGSRRRVPVDLDMNNSSHYQRLQDQANKDGVTFTDAQGAIVVAPMQ